MSLFMSYIYIPFMSYIMSYIYIP